MKRGIQSTWHLLFALVLVLYGGNPLAYGGDLETYSYHSSFLTSREQASLSEQWKSMDMQAARSRLLVEQAHRSCNQTAFQVEMERLKGQLGQMISTFKHELPGQAKTLQVRMEHVQEISPLLEKSHIPQLDMLQFHLYFYNRLLNEGEGIEKGCVASSPAGKNQGAVPAISHELLQQETIRTVDQVHKMTTYMDQVLPLVKKCQQAQYDTYLDPMEALSERILLLRKQASVYAGQTNDDSMYSLLDTMFDEVMTMRNQMEHAWQQGQCVQAATY